MKRSTIVTLAGFAAVLWLSPPSSAVDHTVTVGPGTSFRPRNLTIAVGDTVTWTNNGGIHNVRADDGSFRCANGCDGEGGNGDPSTASWSFTLTFDDPGEILYFCEVHGGAGGLGMSGSITVESGGGSDDPPSDPSPTRFKSGFEQENFADWPDRFCSACNALVATIEEGESLLSHAGGYETDLEGEHRAYLEGPAGVDFDLTLWWWSGSEWIPVASGNTPDARESVSFDGDPGRYRWEVRSASGGGELTLVFTNPNLAAGSINQLIRSEEAARKGNFGLESAYFKGSKKRDYLIYGLPVAAAEFEAEFRVKPLEDLFVRGKKHQIFQALQGDDAVLRIAVLAPEKGDDNHRLFVQVLEGTGKLSDPGFATLETGKWRKIKIVWKAASEPGNADGVVRLFRKKELVWEIDDLDNGAHAINEFQFGQISKGKKKTAGQIYYDDFRARWKEGASSGANRSPVAAVTASPTSVPANDGNQTVVSIDASGSSDPDEDQLTFAWTVPNGTFVNGSGASDESIQVTFPGAAPYTVTVEVGDGRGGNDSAQITIGIDDGGGGGGTGYGG